jgi:hypothetical protein
MQLMGNDVEALEGSSFSVYYPCMHDSFTLYL